MKDINFNVFKRVKGAGEDVFRTVSAFGVLGGCYFGMARIGMFGDLRLSHPYADPYVKVEVKRELFQNYYKCETQSGVIHEGTSIRPVRVER